MGVNTLTPKRSEFKTRVEELSAFKRAFGHCLVPRNRIEYQKLGNWVQRQRANYKNWLEQKPSPMNNERYEQLERLGFVWSIKKHRIEAMRARNSDNNSCSKSNCRKRKIQATNSTDISIPVLSSSEIILDDCVKESLTNTTDSSVLPATSLKKRRQGSDKGDSYVYQPWEVRFEQLKRYKLEHGTCDVPTICKENRQLGTWAAKQRAQYQRKMKGRKSHMTYERINALESIGFNWSKRATDFELRLEELREYKRKFGDCLVSRKNAQYHQLGDWVQFQRAEHKKWREGRPSSMTKQRLEMLEDAGFVWFVNEQWKARLQQLREHMSKHGQSSVPNDIPYNKPLKSWIDRQQQRYQHAKDGKPTTLSEDDLRELEALGFGSNTCQNFGKHQVEPRETRSLERSHSTARTKNDYSLCCSQLSSRGKPVETIMVPKPRGNHDRLTAERIATLRSLGYKVKIVQ